MDFPTGLCNIASVLNFLNTIDFYWACCIGLSSFLTALIVFGINTSSGPKQSSEEPRSIQAKVGTPWINSVKNKNARWVRQVESTYGGRDFVLSFASSDYVLQSDAEEGEEATIVGLTMKDEEGALEELSCVDSSGKIEVSYKDATMEEHKLITPVYLCVDGDSGPKEVPHVDVHIDEENRETDEERMDAEAPIPRPFDYDEEIIKESEEQLEQEGTVTNSEQTAENGWIVILQNPKVPYDQYTDPAGLYGGKEVDDRPSLLEFYHQDARTDGYFAKMAPTKAELAAKTAAAMRSKRLLEATASAALKLQAAPPTIEGAFTGKQGIMKGTSPDGDVPPPPEWSYADVLTSVSETSAPSGEFDSLPFRSVANVSFLSGSKKEKVMNIFGNWQKANIIKPKENAYVEYQKAFLDRAQYEQNIAFQTESDDGAPLLRTEAIREWIPDPTDYSRRTLRITNPSFESSSDDDQDIARSSIEVDDNDPDLEKAIAASLEQHEKETQQQKFAEHIENIDPDILGTLDTSRPLEIKTDTDFHDQFAEIDRSIMMTVTETITIETTTDNTPDTQEEADIERAIWESMQESPGKKRKSSVESLVEDGVGEEEFGARRVEREWMVPRGVEGRRHKRCRFCFLV